MTKRQVDYILPVQHINGKWAAHSYKQRYTYDKNDIGVRYFYGYKKKDGTTGIGFRQHCRNTKTHPVSEQQEYIIKTAAQIQTDFYRYMHGYEIIGFDTKDFINKLTNKTITQRYKTTRGIFQKYRFGYYIEQWNNAHPNNIIKYTPL